jgi:hypothetical protein
MQRNEAFPGGPDLTLLRKNAGYAAQVPKDEKTMTIWG